ncbi:hypothetical protein Bsp3421_003700 [Burkholderia sp. FERM BP-3421]|jgi:hypothetical protein|uniref:hypothetical protein n=1 Tax=Burkholderia sp. FERM BP-3421 TaxID=1494466 RepID=UPI00235DF2EC|nr:hypothetical protein [Burkholderia sp. FERM BP-3421]WDD93609.1 hypothetical protein Bsp3421_003700 [Burkholderia sp. FERM BP-3421]
MKHWAIALACVAAAGLSAPSHANDAGSGKLRTVTSCTLADGTHATLKAEPHGEDGEALFVDEGGEAKPAFLDMPDTQFVGQIALARCVDGVLVFALAYGPPYLKGVAIRRNPQTHADERLYFAEKALPKWLYLSDKEMLVVIPNIGHETEKKYLVYRYVAGKGQPDESAATDTLPASAKALLPVQSR